MEEKFKERIGYEGEIKNISLRICEDYNLGKFKSSKVILMGYEDFNFILETAKGKYFVKVFAKFRSIGNCNRYVGIIGKAIDAGVSTPELLKGPGFLHILKISDVELRLCVFEFIEGKTLFESGEKLDVDEIKFIANQAAIINSINIRPELVDDEWAITNFIKEFKKKKNSLNEEDLKLIEPLVEKFKELEMDKLPYCFVHGDIISTNVMKDSDDKLWIIDFSVSNYYPRIQELAVLACNLFFDEKSKEESKENFRIMLEEYQKKVELTQKELDLLEIYIQFAHAMHLLSGNFEKFEKGNESSENDYWINQGRKGLIIGRR